MSTDPTATTRDKPNYEDHLRQGSKVGPLASAFAGSISGLVARTVTAPLDVVKIKLQLQTSGDKYKGILHTTRVVVREEGFLGLWKGNVPAAAMYIIYGAVQFSSYSYYNSMITDLESRFKLGIKPEFHSLILGSLAGGTSTLVSYPLDLLRTRFVHNAHGFLSMRDTVDNILKNEGFVGLYKGLNTGLVSISAYSGLLFWSYESSRLLLYKTDLDPKITSFIEPLCGTIAGFAAKALVFPLDLIRKRLQVNVKRNRNFLISGWLIVKREGLRGLYKGFLASVLKTAPTTGISIWAYEYSLRCMESVDF